LFAQGEKKKFTDPPKKKKKGYNLPQRKESQFFIKGTFIMKAITKLYGKKKKTNTNPSKESS